MISHEGFPRKLMTGLASALVLSLAACGGGSGGGAPTGEVENPAAVVPPTITDPTVTLAASVSAPDASGVVTINLSGLPAGTNLPASAFTVVESDATVVSMERPMRAVRASTTGEAVKPLHSVDKIGAGGARAGADIAFVFDTTGSMSYALDSVKGSIVGFVDHLQSNGLDVQVGAVTFGDAFDTKMTSGGGATGASLTTQVPPSFDSSERPSFSLTTNFEEFKAFIAEQRPRGGNNSPENALGALEFAYDTLSWRAGAQRIVIVIMDICSHNADTYTEDGITAPWIPKTVASVLEKLKGQAIVHVISPASALDHCGTPWSGTGTGVTYTDMQAFTGVAGTGGVHVDWDGDNLFDLTSLPITEAVTSGYLIKYVTGVDGARRVRVVVDDGGAIRGETTVVSD